MTYVFGSIHGECFFVLKKMQEKELKQKGLK